MQVFTIEENQFRSENKNVLLHRNNFFSYLSYCKCYVTLGAPPTLALDYKSDAVYFWQTFTYFPMTSLTKYPHVYKFLVKFI